MPQANLTAQLLGLGGAAADSYNRLSINAPAMLFSNAGVGIEATFNKNAPAHDVAFAFKTGFFARTLIGLLGSDGFSFKVSPDGGTFHEAIKIDRNSDRIELPELLHLPSLLTAQDPPPAGKLAVYARDRAGAGWLYVQRPSGRFFPLQPHFGVNRIATWAPSSDTTVNTNAVGSFNEMAGSIEALKDAYIATRVSSDTAGQRLSFSLTGPTGPAAVSAIAGVHLKQIAQAGTTGPQATAGFLRIDGVNHDAPPVAVPVLAPKPVYSSWALNPVDDSAWTSVTLPEEVGILSA